MTAHSAHLASEAASATLPPLINDIAFLRDSMEADFVAAGDCLVQACDQFIGLEGPMKRVAGLTEAGAIKAVATAVQEFDRRVRAKISESSTAIRPMLDLSTTAESLRLDLSDLSRVVRTMGIVALNARVIVACIGSTDRDLNSFSMDARELVEHAGGLISTMQLTIEKLLVQANQLRKAADILSRALDVNVSKGLTILSDQLVLAERWLNTTVSASSGLAQTAERIRSNVVASVMALQTGDATRQRLDHIIDILQAPHSNEQHGLAAAYNELARRQIECAQNDHEACLEQASQMLKRTGDGTTEFLADLAATFANSDSGTKVIQTALQNLDATISDCLKVQNDFGEKAGKLVEGYLEVIRLSEGVEDLGNEMHLIGLNAVISCSNLGPEGLPLKETAKQLRDLVGEAKQQRDRLGEKLRAMAEGSEAARQTFEESSQGLDNLLSSDRAHIAELLGNVEAPIRDLSQVLASEDADLDGTIDVATQILRKHGQTFADLCTQVLNMAPLQIAPDPAAFAADVVIQLREKLTMAAERDVHDAWVADMAISLPDEHAR
jgi:hypothetical protein